MQGKSVLVLPWLVLLISTVSAKVWLEEKFDDNSWEQRWQKSSWKVKEGTAGDWKHTAGKWYGDESDKGIQTSPDARFYTLYSELEEEFDNTDKPLVLQFSVKHEQKLDCGGGYIKLIPAGPKMVDFGGDTPYSLMFGPDICGFATKRIHAIITYKEKNLLTKKQVDCETDQLTHVYTFIILPTNEYKILVDGEEKASGSLYDDWDFLPPKKIKDPKESKPKDWVDEEEIDDPSDKKPKGWDDILAEIPQSDATKPDDWDDEDDGVWEPPMISNPDYKGEWKPKRIKNPKYKGPWIHPEIDNPDFVNDTEVYKLPPIKYVGFELWQVKAGTIFDNILLTDDQDYAAAFRDETWGKFKEAEKEMFDAAEKERKEKEEAESKKFADAKAADEDEEDEDDEDEDIVKPKLQKDEL